MSGSRAGAAGRWVVLLVIALAALAGVLWMAWREPRSTAPSPRRIAVGEHAPPANRMPAWDAGVRATRPSATPTRPTAAAGASPEPVDDAAFLVWLRGRPRAEVRAELAAFVARSPGTKLVTFNCDATMCQSNVHADSPEAFDAFTKLLSERYRGHIGVIASVDHPSAPDRVVGSVSLATDAASELIPLGAARQVGRDR